jgi:hypothetical protein
MPSINIYVPDITYQHLSEDAEAKGAGIKPATIAAEIVKDYYKNKRSVEK